ncbi:hypothetical protein ACLKA6_001959 [Drosophila palustris]
MQSEPGTPKKPTGILDSSSSAAAAALKPGQCSTSATATVTMPAVCTNGAGPSKPAFHPGLGVKGIILPPPDTSEPKQSAKSAAKAPTGTGTVSVVPTASVGKKFSYTEKRSAGWILQRHVASTGSNRSADWLKKVEWAKTVLPDFDMQSPRALDQAKRQRSQEAPGPSAKKSRVQQGRSFAQIAKERVLVGVLDQGNAAIPRNQWKNLDLPLSAKTSAGSRGNVKVIACDDERSAELYKTAVSNIGEVYPGAKLVAVNWKDVPVRPRARLWIPSSIKEPERLLKMLQRCNPSLPTHDWKVAKIEEMPGPTNQAVMILNKESLAPIDAAGGELNFGFSSVHIRVYKSDATPCDHLSEKPSEEEITDLEAPERPELDGYTSDASTITRDLSALCNMGEMELTSDVASDDEDANTTVVEAASAALLLRLAGNGADIALIQEPWIVGGKVSGLRAPEYKLIVAESQALATRIIRQAVTSTLGSSTLTRLLCDIEGGGCQLVAYADDVAMIFTGKYPQTQCDLMTVKLSNLAAWADKCGLGVNPDRTELVLFTRRYKVPTLISPKLKDSALSFSDSAKYLGLVLDKKLDWNQSTHDRCRKATIALYTCRKAIGIKWGMSPYIVRWLYTAIIRPILLYGILVWWPALSRQSIKKQINKVQRMAEICITGALNTTPNDALDAILNFPSIQLTSQAVATLAAIRIRDTNNWGDFHSGHSLILKENAIVPPKTDCCVPTEHVTTPFNKSQATPGKINIYSDSQAAIKSIASTTSKSTSVSKCRRSLHEMAELFDICLVWVPGHQDIQGNCIADELARRGTTDTLLPDKEDISMPLATCKLMLHNLFEEKHNVQWYSTPNCRVARQTWPHIDKARSKTLCNLSRTDCSRVVRSITGHWLVGVHALRLKAPYNDFCRSCRDEEEEESPEHFFCFCPALSNRRRRALGKPSSPV